MDGKKKRDSLLNRNYHKNGQVLYCQWLISVRFEQNQPCSFLSFVQDVTAREQMREALQESEEKFRQLAEHIDGVFYITALDNLNIIYVSPSFNNLWELSMEQLLKEPNTWVEAIHPADNKRVQAALENMKQSGAFEEEYRIILPTGKERWIRDRAFPIYNQNGQIYRVAGIAEDITSYKNSQEELQQRHFELNQLYGFSKEIGYTVQFSEVITVLNHYLYRLLPQLSCSSLILIDSRWHDWYELFISSRATLNQTVQETIHHEIVNMLATNKLPQTDLKNNIPVNLMNENEIEFSTEISHLGTTQSILLIDNPSKEFFAREVIGILWLGAKESEAFSTEQLRIGYTLVNHLVDALKRIRIFLSQEQEQVQNLVQYLPVGVILLDTQQHIVLANQVAQKYLPLITQTQNNDLLTGIITSILTPLFEGSLSSLLAEPVQLGDQLFEITAQPLKNAPYTNHHILIIQEVTERQRMVELVTANQHKNEFLANMSHELRTPLTSILGGSEILTEQVYGALNDQQKKYITHIERSGKHLLSLINDILDLSKIEAGKVELQYDTFSINELCETCMLFVKESAHKKRLQVSPPVKMAPELDTFYADQRRMKQVLINLLNNAVKFTPEGGHITLKVWLDIEKQVIHFSVKDTGIGIASEDMERLFKPFERMENNDLVREAEGTGLGLALVQRLVELHGGSIHLTSELGQGSCFSMVLPNPVKTTSLNNPELNLPDKLSSIEPQNEASPLILLAEDNQTNIDLVVDYLNHLGYRVNVAHSGIEALDSFDKECPDLILMDIQMPGMDGLEVTRSLRADIHCQNLPIIALTALTMPGDRERCLEAGMTDYLSKPVGLHDLARVIKQYL